MSDPSDPNPNDLNPQNPRAKTGHDADVDAPIDPDALAALEVEVRALRDAPLEADTLARMRAGLDARIAAASPGASSPTPISSHPRWRSKAGLLTAAAVAAAAAVLLLLSPLSPLLQPAVEPGTPVAPLPRDLVQEEGAPPVMDTPAESFADASDEELAIAIDYELLSDYDVIAQLDLLELLDETGRPVGAGSPAPEEGRI